MQPIVPNDANEARAMAIRGIEKEYRNVIDDINRRIAAAVMNKEFSIQYTAENERDMKSMVQYFSSLNYKITKEGLYGGNSDHKIVISW